MNPALMPKSFLRWRAFRATSFVATLAVFAAVVSLGHAQGTLTITFSGPPPGQRTQSGANPYNDPSGMQFGSLTPQSLYLNGGGIPGSPDNGTTYLEIPVGSMTFGYGIFPPGQIVPFNLVSFDAAEYGGWGPQTLTVVGYVNTHVMGPPVTVTNYFTVTSQTFQTFHLDSSFQNIYLVNVFNASWSLDNVTISSVPEPATGSLALVGAGGAVAWWRFRRKQRHRQTHA